MAFPPSGIFAAGPSNARSVDLFRREAVEVAFAADLAQLFDRTPWRRVCGVPRRRILAAALAIVMADLRAAATLGAVGPVAAGRGRGSAVEIGTGQDVVTVRCIAAAVVDLAFFVQRVFLRQLVGVAMEI